MNYAMMTYTVTRQMKGQPVDMAEICRLTRDLGLDAMDQISLYGYEAKDIRRIADDHGVGIIGYTFKADLDFADRASWQAGVDEIRRGAEIARELGASMIMVPVTGRGSSDRDESRRNVVAGFAEAAKAIADTGVTLTTENFHSRGPFVTSADIKPLLDAVPDVCVTFDSGNVITGGEDPVDSFLATRSRIAHVHFKDFLPAEEDGPGISGPSGRRFRPALIGEGMIDYPKLIRTMTTAGYEGYINIEYEGNDYRPDDAIRRALDYLNGLEKQVASEMT